MKQEECKFCPYKWIDAEIEFPEYNIPHWIAGEEFGIINYMSGYYDGDDWYECQTGRKIKPKYWQKIITIF